MKMTLYLEAGANMSTWKLTEPPPNNALESWGNFTAIALQQNKFYSIGHRSPVLLDCIQLLHFIHITTYFLFWSNQVLLNWRPAVQRSFPQWWVFSDYHFDDMSRWGDRLKPVLIPTPQVESILAAIKLISAISF